VAETPDLNSPCLLPPKILSQSFKNAFQSEKFHYFFKNPFWENIFLKSRHNVKSYWKILIIAYSNSIRLNAATQAAFVSSGAPVEFY